MSDTAPVVTTVVVREPETTVVEVAAVNGGGGGGAAGVASFAGRTGAVAPLASDYPPALIGAATAAALEAVEDASIAADAALDARVDALEAAPGGGATTLDGLTDVTITAPTTGQVLTYAGSQWVNGAAPGGGGSGLAPTTDLPVTTGLLADFDLSAAGTALTGANTTKVALLRDGSGNLRHAILGPSAALAAAGVLAPTGINGLPALTLDNVDDSYDVPIVVDAPYTIVLVFRTPATIDGLNHRVIQSSVNTLSPAGGRNWLVGHYAGFIAHHAGGFVSQNALAAVANTTYVCVARNDGTASSFRVNGVDRTQNGAFVNSPGRLALGVGHFGEPASCSVGRLAVVHGALNLADIQTIETALRTKWGAA